MKKLLFSIAMSVLFISATNAQYELAPTGFPGDDFSLEGAIEVFRNSNSVQDFEYRLNQRDVYVNNLDLDQDGRIDFIRVQERNFGDLHAVVLQVPLSRYEIQDVAVIQIEKTGNRRAILQIIGDEDIYGDEVIVEPFNTQGYSSGRGGPSADFEFRNRAINVFYWAVVRDIFRNNYNPWQSPYNYSYYPNWWSPWNPYGWNVYNQRRRPYYSRYRITNIFRVQRVNVFYRPFRTYSPRVRNRCEIVRNTPRQNRGRINSVNQRISQNGSARTQRSRNNVNQIERSKPARSTARQSGNVSRSKPYSSNNSNVQRTKSNRSSNGNSSVKRSQPSRSSNSSVKRSQPSRSSNSSVKRSQPSRSSSSSVKRSQPSRSSSSSVRRSQSSRSNNSSVKRSQPSRSSSSSVKRSQPSRSSSSSVRRSQPSRSSSSSVKRSSSTRSSGSRSSSSKNRNK